METCPACGAANDPAAPACARCGQPLPRPLPRHARKVVTVLFSDVTGSTVMGEQLDPESLRLVMERYFAAMRAVLERHGATIEKYIGDAVMAVFGMPRAHEDDALRAVRAAVEMRAALDDLNRELGDSWGVAITTRTGLNTGEVISGDADARQSLVVGDTVNVAARLEQAAEPGEILIGQSTLRLVRDAVAAEPVGGLTVKGKSGPVPAWRVVEVRRSVAGWNRRLDSPLVAREQELARLRATFDRAVETSTCQAVTVIGPAGIGKSRLTNEFIADVIADARVAFGRCAPYGQGVTFAPAVDIVQGLTRIGDADDRDTARAKLDALLGSDPDVAPVRERIAGLLGLSEALPSIQETFWAVRRLLEVVAREQPLIVVVDDVHWGEPTLLDLLEYLAGWLSGAAVVLVFIARPELLEERPGWLAARANTTVLEVDQLAEPALENLMRNLLDGGDLDQTVRARIAQLAEGNPLFVEETLRMLVDDGLLTLVGESWTATGDLSTISIPATIHALVAARLDRLADEERATIQRASVVGREFWWGALAELTPPELRGRVGHHLQSLTRKQLIRAGHSQLVGEDEFEFTHAVVRDAAYQGMPKETRAELHERLVAWIDRRSTEWGGDYEEMVGYHLEQAHRSRIALGPATPATTALGRRAAELLATAGRRAFTRGDMPAAVNLLERAASLVGQDEPLRLDVLPRLAFALMETGSFERLMAVVAEAQEAATVSGDARLRSHATVLDLYIRLFTNPESWAEEAERESRNAIAAFEQLGDHGGVAKAWALLGLVNVTKGRFAAAEDAWEGAASNAERAGERRDQLEALGWVLLSMWAGPAPVDEGLERCQAVLAAAGSDHKALATAMFMRAVLEADTGRIDSARQLIGQARGLLQEVAMTTWMAGPLTQMAGFVELAADDPAAAERVLRSGYDTLEAMGEMAWRPTLAALLAEAAYAQGRHDDAEALATTCRETAGADDAWSQVLWRTVTARLLARRGVEQEAERTAREALERAEATDSLELRGHALVAFAEVVASLGRPDEAASAVADAVALFGRKGNTQAATAASRRLAQLRR